MRDLPLPAVSPSKWTALATLLAALLAVAGVVALLYYPVGQFQFLEFDDDLYVTENLEVRRGLAPGVWERAWRTNLAGNWQPVTFLSHALDVHVFGLEAGWHHAVNVAWHAANAMLLMLLAVLLGLPLRPAALLALLFALHPLRIESVAWVAERKDVLSTFFFLLTLLAYVLWTRHGRAWLYAVVLLCFGLGLMSKAMLVTLPFVLLVLDWWPLERGNKGWRRLVWEKWPLFVLTAVICVVALAAQQQAGALRDLGVLPAGVRVQTALVAYAAYLGKSLYPAGLSPFYTHPQGWPIWQVAGAAVLLATITAAVWHVRHTRPWWLAGWLWYLGTLVPVIGLVQIGDQWMADRYTYIPMIGPVAAGVVEAWKVAQRGRTAARLTTAAGLVAVLALASISRSHLPVWRDTASLSAAGVTHQEAHWSMRTNAAIALAQRGELTKAINAFGDIFRDYPRDAESANNLGFALLSAGREDQAVEIFERAVALDPNHLGARVNLGQALLRKGNAASAVAQFARVMENDPRDPSAFAWAALAVANDDPQRALAWAGRASELTPGPNLVALDATGHALSALGRHSQAAVAWREAAMAARRGGQDQLAASFEQKAAGARAKAR